MKIAYDQTLDDYVAYLRNHQKHSPLARRQRQTSIVAGPAMLFCLFLAFAVILKSVHSIIAGTIGAFALLAISPRLHRKHVEGTYRGYLKEAANKGLFGPHELELTDDELIMRRRFYEARLDFCAIERVDVDGQYTIIHVSGLTGFVIPHERVSHGNPVEFTATLKTKVAQISGTRSPED